MYSVYFEKRGDRVEQEATALSTARHPGVVELVDVTDGALRTRRVEGKPLSEMGPLPADEVAGLAAAVAATLADLHDLGVVHGGVDASHVIVAADGHPVLCSLGRGGHPADDVAALGRLLATLTRDAGPDPLRARLQLRHPQLRHRRRLGPMLSSLPPSPVAALAAEATIANPERRPTARALAAALRDRVPGARLPRLHDPAHHDPGDHDPAHQDRAHDGQPLRVRARPWLPWALVGSGAFVVMSAVAGWALFDRPAADGPAAQGPEAQGPEAQRSSERGQVVDTPRRVWPVEPLHFEQGVLTYRGARYGVGQAGDSVVAGDWRCSGQPTLVLLRPSTGQVFAFDDWAGDTGDVGSRPLGQVPAGIALSAVDTNGDGCHELEVARRDGPPAHLDVTQ